MAARFRTLLPTLLALACWLGGPPAGAAGREIAITVDDVPVVVPAHEAAALDAEIVGTLQTRGVPAVGFVNEGRLLRNGRPDPARVAALARWLDAGLELGNHTRSHLSLGRVPPDRYEADVIAGEATLTALLAQRAKPLRYFRPPNLHTGKDPATRARLDAFLAARGYILAPVTVGNDDWIFAAAYGEARRRGLAAEAGRVAEAYLEHTRLSLLRAEGLAMDLLGRPVRQILLLHASALNAAQLPRLLDLLEARGYRFVSLDHALEDPAYRLPHTALEPPEEPWLERWARAAGMRPAPPPPIPPFVRQLAGREMRP